MNRAAREPLDSVLQEKTESGTVRKASAGLAWDPLRHPLFRALWTATLASNIGTWMQDVGAAWLMTTLDPSPIMVSLVQAAMTFPIFVLALPAGAIADVLDRRKLLLVAQGWMMIASGGLALTTFLDVTTPPVLLGLTAMLGIGAALSLPAWQAIVSELVPRRELAAAISLNGVAINIARGAGPALGGVLIAATGPELPFLLNAASFVGVVVVLYRWHREPPETTLPAERFIGAIRVGLRYLRHSPDLKSVLVRGGLFIVCGSALWALVPIVARAEMGTGPAGYGTLLAFFGVGAILGAWVLPHLKQNLATNRLVGSAVVVFALVLVGLAHVRNYAILCGVMLAGGASWLALLATLNVSVQTTVPAWVRARALSLYMVVIFGGMAAGSTLWGIIATKVSVPSSLTYAAFGLVFGLVAAYWYRLRTGESLNLAPSRHSPAPEVVIDADPEQGPVMVTVEYHIDPAQAEEFTLATRPLSRIRRRDGAIQWALFADVTDPGKHVEAFICETWNEHLRYHERVTVSDREVMTHVRSFHIGKDGPVVRHFIAETLPKKPTAR